MFEFLKTKVKEQVELSRRDLRLSVKTNEQIIQEIHDSFYSEVDLLLAEAKISKSTETSKSALIEKAERLKKLGFGQTKECQEADAEIQRLSVLQIENANKAILVSAINYFSFNYPNYKFITEDSVKKICAKYNLIYSEISRYTGTVPDKNLKHIEDFKINENDECWTISKTDMYFGGVTKHYFSGKEKFEAREKKQKKQAELKRLKELSENGDNFKYYEMLKEDVRISYDINSFSGPSQEFVSPLEIVAPLSDFNTTGMELKNFTLSKIEIPDPIVLKPVFYGNQKHYLIVTAWGLEGSDELVVNQKMN